MLEVETLVVKLERVALFASFLGDLFRTGRLEPSIIKDL